MSHWSKLSKIHDVEQHFGVVHDRDQELPVLLFAPAHDVQDVGLQVAPGLDVNVDVGDAVHSRQV